MAEFLTDADLRCIGDKVWYLLTPLEYYSDVLHARVTIPKGFYTDLASVPRVPVVYWLWGGRSHYEAIVHDYLFRKGALPECSWGAANKVFLEAMKVRGKSSVVRYPMYWGVCWGSFPMWKAKPVEWEPI